MAIEDRETGSLIGGNKVEGTAVYGAAEKNFGSVKRVMLGKTRDRVAHAVLSFCGFLGIGGSLPAALAVAEVRSASRRIHRRPNRG